MLEFEFEVLTESSIHLRYNYGGEWFSFNLFLRDDVWILHPFEGILLGNKEMCRLVIADLFSNKPFLVMLAKERILLSNIQSSIDLGREEESVRTTRDFADRSTPVKVDDMDAFIQEHTLEEVIELEKNLVSGRISYFKEVLQRMFMDGLGPDDTEFEQIRDIVRIYEDTLRKFENVIK
jgi:hypothetical protein